MLIKYKTKHPFQGLIKPAIFFGLYAILVSYMKIVTPDFHPILSAILIVTFLTWMSASIIEHEMGDKRKYRLTRTILILLGFWIYFWVVFLIIFSICNELNFWK
jgi:hypothetical protein